jgi:hypothetical protein
MEGMPMRTSVCAALLLALVFTRAAAAQEKVSITEKVQLTQAALPDGAATPELKTEYLDFFQALEAELKAQAASFNAECQWNIVVKLVIKPKSKVVEVTLEPKGSLSPRIFSTGFPRKATSPSEDAYREQFKALVKTIVSRSSTCTS